jgi:hypothetical protein
MNDLFANLHGSTIATLLVVSMVPTYLLMLVQAVYNRPLRNASAPWGIVSLQFARTTKRSQQIIASWGNTARTAAIPGLWLDYLYLVSYAITMVLGCVWSARQFGEHGFAWLMTLKENLPWLVILAAMFDATENLAHLVQLYSRPKPPWPFVAFICASAKFLLIFVGLTYTLAGVVAWVAVEPIDRLQIVIAVIGAGILILAYLPSLPELLRFAFRHAALVFVVVLVYGLVYGQIGTDYGIVSLFWNDRLTTRISASLGVTLLLADLGIVVYFAAPELVAAMIGPPPWNGTPRTVAKNLAYLTRFLTKGGLPFVLLLLAPAVLPAVFTSVPRTSDALAGGWAAYAFDALIWGLGIAIGAVVPLLILFLIWLLYKKLLPGGPHIKDDTRISILIFYVAFVGLYALFAGPLYDWTSPAFAICTALGVLLMIYALVQYFVNQASASFGQWPVPPGAILVGLLILVFGLANNDPYKLRFPEMTAYGPGGDRGIVNLRKVVREQYGQEKQPMPSGGATLVDDQTALRKWLGVVKDKDRAADQKSSDKPKLVIVSMSGGATRSAYWSAVVLDRLETQIPGFGDHVRIVTGASGGMVGAAYYVKQRQELSSGAAAKPLATVIPLDSITPVAAYIALRDVWQALLPRMGGMDRGIVLEQDWKGIDLPIQQLRKDEEDCKIPSIILSPMMIEDGRRLLISNLDLRALSSAGGSEVTVNASGSDSRLYSLSAVEFFRLFPYATNFHLATGVRMSASFPYVSPAVNLPTDPPRRVVDAGYYDNYGIQLAAAWVQVNLDWLIHQTSGVVLVQIRDAISEEERLDVVDAPTGFWATLARGAQFFTSPPEAAEEARSASGLFRNDQDVQALSTLFSDYWTRRVRDQIKDDARQKQALRRASAFLTTVVFENSAEVTSGPADAGDTTQAQRKAAHHSSQVALNWYLSKAEQDALQRAIFTPPAGTTKEQRLAKIDELREQVTKTHGRARNYWLSQLQTAVNYEQLVQLSQWWQQPAPLP